MAPRRRGVGTSRRRRRPSQACGRPARPDEAPPRAARHIPAQQTRVAFLPPAGSGGSREYHHDEFSEGCAFRGRISCKRGRASRLGQDCLYRSRTRNFCPDGGGGLSLRQRTDARSTRIETKAACENTAGGLFPFATTKASSTAARGSAHAPARILPLTHAHRHPRWP